jgi:four helix bundle protein
MNENEFKKRTKQFALEVIALIGTLSQNKISDVLCRQLLRSSTSVGANYRSACRAKSPADMVAKLSIVEEEADESIY